MKILVDFIDNYTDDYYKKIYDRLDNYNKKKINKISIDSHKKECLLAQGMLMLGLMKYFNLNYDTADFRINKYGKPYIKNSNIYFNISHSKGFVVCAFNEDPIGVDVEQIREVNIKIIDQFCTRTEKRSILESKKKMQELFKIYTMKEAYFKMLGTNLKNIKTFDVNNSDVYFINKIEKINNISYIISICTKEKGSF